MLQGQKAQNTGTTYTIHITGVHPYYTHSLQMEMSATETATETETENETKATKPCGCRLPLCVISVCILYLCESIYEYVYVCTL